MRIIPNSLTSRIRANFKAAGLVGIACVTFGVALSWIVTGHTVNFAGSAVSVEHFLESISSTGLSGLLIVIAVMVLIASTGFLPASIIGIASGTIYGLLGGFLISAFATLVGAAASFVISRSFFREAFEKLIVRRNRIHIISDEVSKHGWRFVCLLRMSPIMPFAITSYALGLSSIRTRDYVYGTAASLPALFVYVCLGRFAHEGLGSELVGVHYMQWALLAIGLGATLFLIHYVKRTLAAAIKKSDSV